MTSALQQFDPIRYKTMTRNQWESAAEAWHRWGNFLSEWLGPATELMLDMANIQLGQSVLDVAAGAGNQTLDIARRVGASGSVLATDLSPTILSYATEVAKAEGLTNIQTRELDGESLMELDAESFDAVVSRVGMIYFPDQQKALQGMKHVLKSGGKVAAMVYATADKNGFFSIPVSIIRKRANLPQPLPGQPGPFSLGAPGVLEQIFAQAGFQEIAVKTVKAPVKLPSAADCLRFEKESFGALHQMLAELSPAEQEETWQEIEAALREFETNGQFEGPCELMIAVGTK